MVPPVSGQFETHLTVRAETALEMATAGDRLGLKFIDIVLDRGDTPHQPMFTGRGSGTLAHQLEAASAWREGLAGFGLEVIRVKVEAAPWCEGVPQTDHEARIQPPDRYFEHHLKLLLDRDAPPDLAAIVAPHGAHLSRNARRIRRDGKAERFVTQRCHGVGRSTARERLSALRKTLAAVPVLEVEEEYVVFDSDLSVDAGWMEEIDVSGPR